MSGRRIMLLGALAMPALAQTPARPLRVAIILSNPVLVTRGPDGVAGGLSVGLARALAERLGRALELVGYENPARYNASLGQGAWDVGLAARDPARGEHLAFSVPFLEVDNGYVAVAGSALRHAEEVDRPGIRVAVAEGSAPDGVLTRNLRAATLVRVPGGQEAARAALTEGRADVYGENVHLAHRIAETLPGTRVLEGRFNLVLMSIAVPKSEAEQAMPAINAFVAEALRDGLVARLIAEAGLRGVRLPA